MDHSNSAIIRKAYEDFAQGTFPRSLPRSTRPSPGAFLATARYRGTIPATTKSETSFVARWNFREAL
jgi:hypothetical protein